MNIELMVAARKARHSHHSMWKNATNNTNNTATKNQGKASK